MGIKRGMFKQRSRKAPKRRISVPVVPVPTKPTVPTYNKGKYYDLAGAAQFLGVDPSEINRRVQDRRLYGYRSGDNWKFKVGDIQRHAANQGAKFVVSHPVYKSRVESGDTHEGATHAAHLHIFSDHPVFQEAVAKGLSPEQAVKAADDDMINTARARVMADKLGIFTRRKWLENKVEGGKFGQNLDEYTKSRSPSLPPGMKDEFNYTPVRNVDDTPNERIDAVHSRQFNMSNLPPGMRLANEDQWSEEPLTPWDQLEQKREELRKLAQQDQTRAKQGEQANKVVNENYGGLPGFIAGKPLRYVYEPTHSGSLDPEVVTRDPNTGRLWAEDKPMPWAVDEELYNQYGPHDAFELHFEVPDYDPEGSPPEIKSVTAHPIGGGEPHELSPDSVGWLNAHYEDKLNEMKPDKIERDDWGMPASWSNLPPGMKLDNLAYSRVGPPGMSWAAAHKGEVLDGHIVEPFDGVACANEGGELQPIDSHYDAKPVMYMNEPRTATLVSPDDQIYDVSQIGPESHHEQLINYNPSLFGVGPETQEEDLLEDALQNGSIRVWQGWNTKTQKPSGDALLHFHGEARSPDNIVSLIDSGKLPNEKFYDLEWNARPTRGASEQTVSQNKLRSIGDWEELKPKQELAGSRARLFGMANKDKGEKSLRPCLNLLFGSLT